jgi:NADH dehydrogenase
MASDETKKPTVVIVGAGFAGVACAKELAKHDIPVTLIDRHNYQQFQPLLYQVATAELGTTDVARPIRAIFAKAPTVKMRQLEVTKIDPETKTVTTGDGQTFTGDYLIVAAGARPNFYGTPGAEKHSLPLYSVPDAKNLRTRVFELFEEAADRPELIDKGALNFVIVGAGPTGVETAGALADLVNQVMPKRHHSLQVDRARIYLVDHGQVVLRAFSDKAHEYAAGKLQHNGVQLMLGLGVNEVAEDRVILSDGSEILTRCVVWGGGIQASTVALNCSLPSGRGGTLTAQADLSAEGHPNVFVVGDIAAIPDHDGSALPQLGSVALQSGKWAAENILLDIDGKPRTPFNYKDKGIMAMIGDGAAVAEMGKHHHELHGHVAFAAWLGVHAYLMSGSRTRIDAFIAWASDFIGTSRASSIIEDPDAARIDWGDEEGDDEPLSDAPPEPATTPAG